MVSSFADGKETSDEQLQSGTKLPETGSRNSNVAKRRAYKSAEGASKAGDGVRGTLVGIGKTSSGEENVS